MAWDYEMFSDGKDLRCHIVIASYESIVHDWTKIDKVKWAGLVVDEGQRLKNDKSLLYKRLHQMHPKLGFRALLTGTPLQNNIRELFNLVQFLDASRDAGQLEQQYGDLTSDNIRALHDMIRPFFLRRTKAEVLPFLPPMVQIIVPVSMSTVQKKLYKSILSKSPELIKAICQKSQLKKSERQNLNNILMQLRKCLCHPFVYSRNIEERTLHYDPVVSHQHLIEASGKLQLLGLMLPKLREGGHRVLIFSQFLENLDVVEDFLDGLGNEYRYRRLDGSLSSLQKQAQIDDFNASDSPYFAFLLSTRSGGVGINLASADTVIIMDPDFNPKQDMQALSRAHRIGQKNTVLVFHLVTRDTVEEQIMQKGKKKLALDHVLIERIEDEDEGNLEYILRHGAEALFNDVSADITYTPDSIDRLLDRSQAEQADKIAQDTTTTDQSLSNFARVWQNDHGALEDVTEGEDTPVDTTLWDQILQERELAAAKEAQEKAEGLGRGKRKRAAVNYRTNDEIEFPPVKE
jgi:SNF2 family DNA or RNA helicase